MVRHRAGAARVRAWFSAVAGLQTSAGPPKIAPGISMRPTSGGPFLFWIICGFATATGGCGFPRPADVPGDDAIPGIYAMMDGSTTGADAPSNLRCDPG